MSLTLSQSLTAVKPGMNAFFTGAGGIEPYAYSVITGGAGGTIGSVSGDYAGPITMGTTPKELYDTILVRDMVNATATAKILVGNPLFLFCEVIQKEMGLADGRVFLWDQKVFQPTDSDLYIAVSVVSAKPFANVIKQGVTGWDTAVQTLSMLATLDLDIMSRGPAARDRKEEVVLAFNSIYAQSQQEINSFYIGKLPPSARFLNLSIIDGAAIPYRFKISVNIQYAFEKTKAVPYFDTFEDVEVSTDA